MRIKGTKTFTFEAAHFLEGHMGLCSSIHGHSFKLEVTVTGKTLSPNGSDKDMLVEFSELKRIVLPLIEQLDHSLIVEREPKWQGDNSAYNKVFVLGARPTMEKLAAFIWKFIDNRVPHDDRELRLCRIRLQETATCWVELEGD